MLLDLPQTFEMLMLGSLEIILPMTWLKKIQV
jgi:hypothetical protein